MEKLNNIWFPHQEEPHMSDVEAYRAFWKREKDRCINGFHLADDKVFVPGRLYFHTVYWKIAMYVKVKGKKVRKILTPLLRDIDWDIFGDLERCDEEGKFYALVGSRDFGKALINTATLYTDNGEIQIGNAKIGDKIFGADGKLTTITGVYPQGQVDTFELTLRDGRKVYCCDEHLWKVWNTNKQKYEVLPLKEIKKDFLSKRKVSYKNSKGVEAKYFIPNNAPVEYSENYLPIDPYFLGLWLGDGTKRTLAITTVDREISDYVYKYANENQLKVTQQGISYNINGGMSGGLRNPLLSKFRELELIDNKHIPNCYFYSSIEQRMELLRGLMDTDGCCNKNGVIEFCTTDSNIANGFYRLARSLGISVTVKKVINNTYNSPKTGKTKAKDKYRFNLMTDKPVFKLKRKLDNIKSYRGDKTSIIDIKPYKKEFATCITVDNEDKCFLTDNYTVTHNSIIAGSCVGHQYTFYANSECVVSGGAANYIKLATNKVEDGLLNMHPAFKKQRLVSDWKKEVRAGWKDKSTGQPNVKSSMSVILVRNYQEGTDTMAANGTRPSFHLIDEIGTIPNLIGCIKDSDGCWWSGSDEEIEEGVDKEEIDDIEPEDFENSVSNKPSCLVFLAGTGGDMNKGKEAAEVFFDPEAYNLLEFENEWEGGGRIGRFISALRAKMNYKEKKSLSQYLGISHPDLDAITILVSNEERALKEWWEPTYEKNLRSGNSKTILKFKAYWPCKPSDSFIVLTQNDFNTEAAKIQQSRLKAIDSRASYVKLFHDGEKITWEYEKEKLPVTEFPVKSQNTDAPIQIWEHPPENPPFGLYVAGVDPYRQSSAEYSDSLGVVYIYKRMNSIIGEAYQNMFVACYAARPESKDRWNENARNLIKYYNARTLCENDEMSFIDYMISKNDGHYLEHNIEWLKELVPNSTAIKNRPYGIHRSSLTIRNFLDGTFKSYLDEVIHIERDEITNSVKKETTGVSRIQDPMLLEEICKFSKDTKNKVNTDRVVAAELAVALAFKLDPIIGAVGGATDSRIQAMFKKHTSTAKLFHSAKPTFTKRRKLFR